MAETPALKVPKGWAAWPTISTASKTLGVNQSEARSVIQEAGMRSYPCPDGTTRYRPQDLEQLANALSETPDEPPISTEAAKAASLRIEQDRLRLEFMKEVTDHNKELRGFIKELLISMPQMMEKASALLLAAAARDGDQITKFYESREQLFTAREEALSEKSEREQLSRTTAAAEERKDYAFKQLMKAIPDLVAQVKTTLAVKTGDPKLRAAADLLQSVDDPQLCLLLDDEMALLNDEQRKQLKDVLGPEKVAALAALKAQSAKE
jgi:hypothetical protein